GIICIQPVVPAPQTPPRRPHSPALPGSNPGVLAPSPPCSNPPAPTPLPEPGREPRSPGSQSPCSNPPAPTPLPELGREPRSPGSQSPTQDLSLRATAPTPGERRARTHSDALSVPCTKMLPKPTVTPGQIQVLENGTFTLTCNSSPSADTVLWLRDGASLAPSDRLGLSPDNRTLTVLGVTQGDAGAHQCEVGNPVSTERSEPSTVTVTWIDPPEPIDPTLGSPLTLSCVADSVPAPSYRWVLNGTNMNETGTSLTFNPTTLDHQGTYECQAHNPITNHSAKASVAVRVTGT
ncbi:unnamed protein product, partial [Natator depressus]